MPRKIRRFTVYQLSTSTSTSTINAAKAASFNRSSQSPLTRESRHPTEKVRCRLRAAISTDRRNTCIETLGGCFVVKRFSRSFVELSGNGTQLCLTMYRQIGAFWKVLSQRKRPFALTAAKFALGTTAERTFRPFVGVAATLENGPLRSLATTSTCCGAARRTCRSCTAQHFRRMNDDTADLAAFRGKCEKHLASTIAPG